MIKRTIFYFLVMLCLQTVSAQSIYDIKVNNDEGEPAVLDLLGNSENNTSDILMFTSISPKIIFKVIFPVRKG